MLRVQPALGRAATQCELERKLGNSTLGSNGVPGGVALGDSGGWGVALGSGWVCEVRRGAQRPQISRSYQCCDLRLFGSTHSLSCRTRRSGGADGPGGGACAVRLCGLRAGLGVAPRKLRLSHWTRPILGICVVPEPHTWFTHLGSGLQG